ncbi:glycoside hydrolase family 2 TIM barrel-domain containing protein [soil metagenome]
MRHNVSQMLHTTFLHDGWEFIRTDLEGGTVGYSKAEWLPASVPGHVHADLVANGVIADPHQEMNELGCQWVDKADWSYRTTFEWNAKDGLPNRVLRFEGLDTIVHVVLNGEKVGSSDNMHVPLEIDVSEKLREGVNDLRLDFESAIRVGEVRRLEYYAAESLPSETDRFDERSFVRKAQYMYGWDWGPRLVSCGIWRPMRLLEFASRITDVHVRTERAEEGWRLSLATTYTGEGQVRHALASGEGLDVEGDGTYEVSENDVFAWSPNDPNVYILVTYLQTENGASDVRTTSFGFAETRLLREPDEHGESFEFEVNGEKLWVRGANWIPDHSFPSLVTRTRYREQLERAKDMGFNMLRVWGGGLYETDEFYELCDEMGILVWQDFPFACAYYPDNEAWQGVVRDEAAANIRRLRNHPALALWCGNNENHEMFFNRWGGDRTPARYHGLHLYEKTLPEVVAEVDPGRSYIATSPIGTPPDENAVDAKRRGPNADGWGDQHNWDVWHGRGDWRFYSDSKGRFSSEYGFASSCSMALWRETLSQADDLTARSPAVRWHDKTGKGTETFIGYSELHYPVSETLEDWVYYSQLNQRDALRHGLEHYRRSAFCRGSLIWQMNDCWPVQSWAILDSNGDYKALAYELRRLHDDRLLSIERHNERVKVWAINDGEGSFFDELSVRAHDQRSGKVLKEWSAEIDLEADERAVVLELDLTGLNVSETILVASASSVDPVWRLLGEPKNATLPPAAELIASGYEDGLLRIKTSVPLVDLMLTEDGAPTPFLDNFFSVPEPGVFEVRVAYVPEKVEARSLAGKHRVRVLRGPL